MEFKKKYMKDNQPDLPVRLEDHAGNSPFVSVFGDLYTSNRRNQLTEKFEYGINSATLVATSTASGSVTGVESQAVLQTGSSSSASAELETKSANRYSPGAELYFQFTCRWEGTETTGYTAYIGGFDADSGIFLGFKDGTFRVGYRNSGNDYVVDQVDFDTDTLDWLNFENLNIFRISLGYLGIAPIRFYVQSNLGWVNFHTIDRMNRQKATHISTPTLPLAMRLIKTSGTTANIQMATGSWSAGTAEREHFEDRKRSTENTKTIPANTQTNVLTIRNNLTHNGRTNYVNVDIRLLSTATDGTKNVSFRLLKNATLTNPSFTDVDSLNSVVALDIQATISNGTNELTLAASRIDSKFVQLEEDEVTLVPGDTLTLAVESTGASDILGAIRWSEKF